MATTRENAQVDIYLNTEEAKQQLRELKDRADQLRIKLDQMGKGSPERKEAQAELRKINGEAKALKETLNKRVDLIINGKMAGASIRDLQDASRKLYAELRKLTPATQEFIDKSKRFQEIENRLKSLKDEVRGTSGIWSKISAEIKAFGAVALTYLGFQAISSQINNIINKNAQLSDSLADIQKTTGLAESEVKKLNSTLGKMDTRTATKELRDITVIAGQLGIAQDKIAKAEVFKDAGNIEEYNAMIKAAREELEGFTKSVDMANVALGDEFTGGAAQVADQLGKLRNIFIDVKSTKVESDLLKIGNALNELGAKGAATGPVVADFSNRIGGIGIPLGLTTSQVLGLSATLQELNVNTERGGTAVTRILQRMVNNTEEFARVAGIPVAEFKNLVNTDLFGAFNKVTEGVKKGGASATAFGKILDDLGVDGSGASEVISKLAQNSELLKEKVDLAGQAIQNTDSITKEFEIKNQTLGAEVDKLGKKFYRMITGEGIKNFLSDQVKNLSNFLDWLKRLPQTIEENRAALAALVVVTIAYNASLISATASSIALTTAEIYKKVAYELGFKWLQITTVATKAYGLAMSDASIKTKLATAATRIWNQVLKLNPALLIVGGIIALVEAVDLYRKNTAEAIKLEKDKKALSEQLIRVNKDLELSMSGFNAEISKFNQLSPIERQELIQRIALKLKEAQATLTQMQAQKRQVEEQSKSVGTWQAIGNYLTTVGNAYAQSMKNNEDALNNAKEAGDAYTEGIDAIAKQIQGLEDQYSGLNSQFHAYDEAMKINAVTLDQYQAKLQLLRTALSGAVIGSEEFKKISEEIAKVQKAIAATAEPDNSNAEKIISKTKEFLRQLKEIEIAAIEDEEKREKAALENKFKLQQEEVRAAEANSQVKNQLLIALADQYERDYTALTEKYAIDRQEENQRRDTADLADWYQTKQLLFLEQLNRQEITQDQYHQNLEDLEVQFLQEQLKIAEQYGLDTVAIHKLIQERIQKVNDDAVQKELIRKRAVLELNLINSEKGSREEFAARKAIIDNEFATELANTKLSQEERQLLYAQYYQTIEELSNAFMVGQAEKFAEIINFGLDAFTQIDGFFNTLAERDLQRDNKANEEKKKNLKKQLDAGIISEKKYQSEIEKIDKQYADKQRAIKTQQFRSQQTVSAIQATINTYLAATRAISDLGPIAGPPMAGVMMAMGMVQVANILAQPVPEFRDGKKPTTGMVAGPSHESGGIKLVNSKTGKVEGEMEGDEGIFSRKMYSNNSEIIDAIFEAKGAPVDPREMPVFAAGRNVTGAVTSSEKESIKEKTLQLLNSKSAPEQQAASVDLQVYVDAILNSFRTRMQTLDLIDQLEKVEVNRNRIERVRSLESSFQTIETELNKKSEILVREVQQQEYFKTISYLISQRDDGEIPEMEFEKSVKVLETKLRDREIAIANSDLKQTKQTGSSVQVDPAPEPGLTPTRPTNQETAIRSTQQNNQESPVQIPGLSDSGIQLPEFPGWKTQEIPVLNTSRIIETIKMEEYIKTALLLQQIKPEQPLPSQVSELKAVESTNGDSALQQTLEKLTEKLETMETVLTDLSQNGVIGVWEHRRFKEGLDDIEEIQNSARFGK